jgi:spore coat protein H
MNNLFGTLCVFMIIALVGCSGGSGAGATNGAAGSNNGDSEGAVGASATASNNGDITSFGKDPSETLFDPATIVEVDIVMDAADWNDIRNQTRDLSKVFGPGCRSEPFFSPFTYVPATVTVNGEELQSVGVRKKGFLGSLDNQKPSLKISFDEYVADQELFGMNRLTLNNNKQDPSQIRQCVAYSLFLSAGIPAPRCNFAQVNVNGRELGVFSNVESIKKRFIARHFDDNDGRLYEGTLSDFAPHWINTFEAKTNKDDPDRSDLIAVQTALEETDEELETALSQVINIDRFMTYWALEAMINHGDGYALNRNNFYIYNDPTTGLLEFIPWGADQVLRPFTKFGDSLTFVESILTRRLYQLPATQQQYVTEVQAQFDAIWSEVNILKEIDRMEVLIGTIANDEHAGDAWFDLAVEVEIVRQFVRTRRAVLESVLNEPPYFDKPPPIWPCE